MDWVRSALEPDQNRVERREKCSESPENQRILIRVIEDGFVECYCVRRPPADGRDDANVGRVVPSSVQRDSIAFLDQLRSNHRLHRHPELHRTTLCVTGARNP